MRLSSLLSALRAGNVTLTILISALILSSAEAPQGFPLVSFSLLAVLASVILYFWPNPRGFALGLYLGGLVMPLIYYRFKVGYFQLDVLPYMTFVAVMVAPLFPKILSWKYLRVGRLNFLGVLIFLLGVLVTYYLSGGFLQPYFIYVFALGLGVAISVAVSEVHAMNIVGRVALPLLSVQVYLSALVYLVTHANFYLNLLTLANGVLSDSWLYFSSSIFLFASALLANSDKGYRYLPEAMIAVNLGALASFIILYSSPVYVIIFSLSALSASSNDIDVNQLKATAFHSFFFQGEKVQRDVALLYSKAQDVSDLACSLLSLGLCERAVWLSNEYDADLLKCDKDKLVECLRSYPYVPKGVSRYILGLAKAYPLEAYELALKYSGDPEVKAIAERLREEATQRLKASWDPRVWVGSVIHGYKVLAYVGRGGSMYVLKGIKDGKVYALKIPIIDDVLSRESYKDFLDEYKALISLENEVEGVVKIVDFKPNEEAVERALRGDVSGYLSSPPMLVVEFLEGGTAEDLTARDELFYSNEWEEIVKEIVYRTARNLTDLHSRNWVHLDVKPSNIMFDAFPGKASSEVLKSLREGRVKVKLSDMASARRVWEQAHHYTPEFSPPDQVRAIISSGNVYPGLDVFSLGMTAVYMLTRQMLLKPLVKYYDMAIAELRTNNSKERALAIIDEAEKEYYTIYKSLNLKLKDKEFKELLLRMIHPDPKMRPSAHEIVEGLEGMRAEGRKRHRQFI